MATHIQVVLRDHVENLGKSGEIVRVKPGYARNYLLPRGLAAVATRGNIAQVEHEKAAALARAAKLRGDAEAIAKKIEGTTLSFSMQAGEGDRLFGSIGNKDIADALKARGYDLDRKKIALHEHLKTLGDHEVTIKLGYEVAATIKVTISKA